jgi:hypothetical protein
MLSVHREEFLQSKLARKAKRKYFARPTFLVAFPLSFLMIAPHGPSRLEPKLYPKHQIISHVPPYFFVAFLIAINKYSTSTCGSGFLYRLFRPKGIGCIVLNAKATKKIYRYGWCCGSLIVG